MLSPQNQTIIKCITYQKYLKGINKSCHKQFYLQIFLTALIKASSTCGCTLHAMLTGKDCDKSFCKRSLVDYRTMFLRKAKITLMVNFHVLSFVFRLHFQSPTKTIHLFHALSNPINDIKPCKTGIIYCFRISSILGNILILIIIIVFYHVPAKMTTFKINLFSVDFSNDFYLR